MRSAGNCLIRLSSWRAGTAFGPGTEQALNWTTQESAKETESRGRGRRHGERMPEEPTLYSPCQLLSHLQCGCQPSTGPHYLHSELWPHLLLGHPHQVFNIPSPPHCGCMWHCPPQETPGAPSYLQDQTKNHLFALEVARPLQSLPCAF